MGFLHETTLTRSGQPTEGEAGMRALPSYIPYTVAAVCVRSTASRGGPGPRSPCTLLDRVLGIHDRRASYVKRDPDRTGAELTRRVARTEERGPPL